MVRRRTINLAFLWHMHQPPYEEPRSACFLLPWTWLHAVKDYYDMGEMVRRHPRMRVNVNFTPSLLYQIDQCARDAVPDRTLETLSKPPESLSPAEREYLLRTCLGMADPLTSRLPRYRQIAARYRAFSRPDEAAASLSDEDWRDLGVLFLLAWCGPTLSAAPEVEALIRKGRGYDSGDLKRLIEVQRGLMGRIVPLYRELSASGQVELSTSPFFHPLTPLLITNDVAIEAHPSATLPDVRFAAPEEAERQVRLGIEYFEQTFGHSPAGMWPPEGAVSEALLPIVAARGIRWLATDEEILRRSLGGEMGQDERLLAYVHDNVSLFFRDRVLSDHIGFVYSRWPVDAAVRHFMETLGRYAEAAPDSNAIVLVALDGENAWEFYPDGGYTFLDALYGAIERAEWVEPVTLSAHLDRHGPGEPLDVLAAGTWVDGNFDTWIGDPVKNRAWAMLATAYQVVRDLPAGECRANGTLGGDPARCHLMRAEASDWFWWFGKGHSSIHEREFDYLFRQNLRMVYERLGVRPPEHLDRPVGEEGETNLPIVAPTAFINPAITGRREGYYKWVGAGRCEFAHGSIHRLKPFLSAVHFGFDRSHLFFRVDGFEPLGPILHDDGWVRIEFLRPVSCSTLIHRQGQGLVVEKVEEGRSLGPLAGAEAAAVELLEVSLPVTSFDPMRWPAPPVTFEFYVLAGRGDLEIERFPWDSVIAMEFDPDSFAVTNWFV